MSDNVILYIISLVVGILASWVVSLYLEDDGDRECSKGIFIIALTPLLNVLLLGCLVISIAGVIIYWVYRLPSFLKERKLNNE